MAGAEIMRCLACHPATPSNAIERIEVRLRRGDAGELALAYRLVGDDELVLFPPPAAPAAADGLWKHTCCEVFIAAPGEDAYREFDFAPSGEWAAYAFRAYRDRDESACGELQAQMRAAGAPRIALRRVDAGVELDARLPAGALPHAATWAVGLAAVVEDRAGALSYWALRHPAARPDFHHRDAFALSLGAAG